MDELFRINEDGDLEINMNIAHLLNPPITLIVMQAIEIPSDDEVREALAVLKAHDPDEYALLMEHIPFPDHVVPDKED